MEAHRLKTGERLTYETLAEMSGIGDGTLRSIGGRLGYQPNLATVEKICRALDLTPGDILELIDDPPKAQRKRTRKKS